MNGLRGLLRQLRDQGANPATATSFLQQNLDPRFPSQTLDQAGDFATYSQQAGDAVNAPFGSIAARSNPLQYGTVASRQFKDSFGAAPRAGFDNLTAQPLGAQRRGLSDSLAAGNSAGLAYYSNGLPRRSLNGR